MMEIKDKHFLSLAATPAMGVIPAPWVWVALLAAGAPRHTGAADVAALPPECGGLDGYVHLH